MLNLIFASCLPVLQNSHYKTTSFQKFEAAWSLSTRISYSRRTCAAQCTQTLREQWIACCVKRRRIDICTQGVEARLAAKLDSLFLSKLCLAAHFSVNNHERRTSQISHQEEQAKSLFLSTQKYSFYNLKSARHRNRQREGNSVRSSFCACAVPLQMIYATHEAPRGFQCLTKNNRQAHCFLT